MAVEVSTSSSSWLNSTGIWLFCIENDMHTVTLREYASIKIKVRVGHISPVDKPLVRRRILLADQDMTLPSNRTPALLLVNNSCNFKFDTNAVDGIFNVGNESWAVLVWSFTVVPAATFNERPDHCNAIDLPGMPVNDLNNTPNCSCVSGCSRIDNRDTTSCTYNSDSSSESDQDDHKDNDNCELYTTTIHIRGSTYEDIYQNNLKQVQSAIRKRQDVQVRLLPETDNPKDRNAISVIVSVNNEDLKLGYVGVKKIPKISAAIKACEVVKTSVKCVNSWYIRNLNQRKLKGYIIVCKKGKWLPDSDNNVYNADL